MSKLILANAKVFTGKEFLEQNSDVYIENNIITDITKTKTKKSNQKDTVFKELTTINLRGNYLVPGYIDIHTHGINGLDFSTLQEDDFSNFFESYVKKGTTYVAPTTITMSIEDIVNVLDKSKKIKHTSFLGVHMEGPFINPNKLGAHNKHFLSELTLDIIKKIIPDSSHNIKIITIAPELDIDYSVAKYLSKKGILLSFGHTECGADKSKEVFDNGYLLSTHQFNAMPQIHHRDIGITGMALLDDRVSCEFIPDMHHVSKPMLQLLFKLKPIDRLVMVSDSIMAAGMEDGEYTLGGLQVFLKDGNVTNKDGTISGSSITIAEGVRRMIEGGFNPEVVLRSATLNPSNLLGIQNIGRIEVGAVANVNILDSHFKLLNTFFDEILI